MKLGSVSEANGMKEALLYEKLAEQKVRCNLCAHRCIIPDGERGICQVRENQNGTLYTLVYGRTIFQHVDPVEKKPLFHFYPSSTAFSIATPGCNFRCQWCQNWDTSQVVRQQHLIMGDELDPDQIVLAAQETNSRSVAYTYTEPTIFFEYTYDTARLAHRAGLANIYVTNGFMTQEMLDIFHPYLDAANVDLKAFRDKTYRRYAGARLEPVLDAMKLIKRLGVWLEVTTLVIPGINDDERELRDTASFVATELGKDTPWHISRFFPAYKMTNVPYTPIKTLQRAKEIGMEEGLCYVYVGNLPDEANTVCHQCGQILIRRSGYRILENNIDRDSRCPKCNTPVAGIGMK